MGNMSRNFKSKKYNTEKQYKIEINQEMLELLMLYATSQNPLITKKSLSNLGKLLDLIDEKDYENSNNDAFVILKVTKSLIKLQVEQKILSSVLLKQNIMDEYPHYELVPQLFEEYLEYEIIKPEEVSYVNKFIEERLTYSYMYKYRDEFKSIFDELDRSDNLERLNTRFVGAIENAFTDIRQAKADTECVINDFDMSDPLRSETVVEKTIEELNKPNNKIYMGLKKFNEMLNGGLENGRLYLACGVPKSFKSGTLLNMCLWACKYNKDFILKDPKKKPTVFYVTQENSVRESIDRLYFHLTGKSIKGVSTKEAMRVINEALGINGVNLIIKYRPNKSISTLDLDAMIDEVEAEGNEVVLLVQDYTKRIRSSNYTSDLRIELGNVSDDLCNIAKARNIPVVSGCQLNREAYKAIELAISKGKKDIAKELNASHIGESAMLIENADYAFIINKEEDTVKGDEFLSFKLIATRVKAPKVSYFAQRFENGMKLEEDYNLTKSLSYDSIGDNLKDFNPNEVRDKIAKNNGIKNTSNTSFVHNKNNEVNEFNPSIHNAPITPNNESIPVINSTEDIDF